MVLALVAPPRATAVSRPRARGTGKAGRSGSSSSRTRKSSRPGKFDRKPGRYGAYRPVVAPAVGFVARLLRYGRSPLLVGIIAAIELLVWLNRRPKPSSLGVAGPEFTLPFGDGFFLTGVTQARTVQSQAPGDSVNFNGIPGYFSDTGWTDYGGLGVLRPKRMKQTGSTNTAGNTEGHPDNWQNGQTGQVWEMFDESGQSIGNVSNGISVSKFVASTGSYYLQAFRTTLKLLKEDGSPTDFPTGLPGPPVPFYSRAPGAESLQKPAAAPASAPAVPAVAPAEVPAPAPLPAAVPLPGGAPLLTPQRKPGGVGFKPQPARAPAIPATAQPLGPDAKPATPLPVPPPVTPPGTTVLPGGIDLPANGPKPTLQSISKELGKIEKKAEILLARPQPDLGIGDLTDLLQLLMSFLEEPYEGGEAQLSSPCEKGPDGSPLPATTVSWGAGVGRFNEMRAMLMTVMSLLQVSKDLKQPICQPSRATGNPFTVVFEEVPGGGGGGSG